MVEMDDIGVESYDDVERVGAGEAKRSGVDWEDL
jgi:hypothetical protein